MFTETKISDSVLGVAGICQNCFIKFNEYDEHQNMANHIQAEITMMYRREIETIDIKPEIKTETEEIYFDNMVEEVEVVQQEPPKKKAAYNKQVKAQAALTSALVKLPRKSGYTKIDKDIGLVVCMIDGVKHYQCEFCGKKDFTSRSRLKTHRLIHTSERNFMCQVFYQRSEQE